MSEKKMKAVRFHEYGGPGKLVLEETPVPVPGESEILVKVFASAVNPFDWKLRAGLYKKGMNVDFPFIPGNEASGVIESVGSAVKTFRPGQAVYGRMNRTYADYALAIDDGLYVKPGNLSHAEAATIVIAAQTAWASLFDIADLRPGQSVLIHGAAGSVGIAAVRLAKWKNAFVHATAAPGNVEFVRSIGADNVIDYTARKFEDAVRDADVVLDPLGGETQERSWKVLRKGGILVALVSPPPAGMAEKYGVRGIYRSGGIGPEGQKQIPVLVEKGILVPFVRKVFPLSQAGMAQEMSEHGHGRGKIVLEIMPGHSV
jgi:NADPH:quinone reductase-like Zn-dependent oxidoreductase